MADGSSAVEADVQDDPYSDQSGEGVVDGAPTDGDALFSEFSGAFDDLSGEFGPTEELEAATGGTKEDRPLLAKPNARPTGYLFTCSNTTLKEITTLKIFGAPDRELPQMKDHIVAGTQLFLFNVQSWKLMGTFVAAGDPEKALEKGAFGGKFNSHVRVVPLQASLLEVQMQQRPPGGPMTAAAVKSLKTQLQKGRAAERWVQEAWGSVKVLPTKRLKGDLSISSKAPGGAPNVTAQGAARVVAPRAKAPQIMPRPTAAVARPASSSVPLRSPTASSGKTSGYLFACNNATQKEIEALHILGAPHHEFKQMQDQITPEAELFLFNLQSWKLMGSFVAVGAPGKDLAKGAFGGKFSAHVPVAPLTKPLLEVQLQRRPASGPQSAAEVNALNLHLRKGKALHGQQESWGVAQDAQEPPAKRPRQSGALANASQDSVSLKGNLSARSPTVASGVPGATVGSKTAGYVFLCSNSTQREIQTLKTFGAPDRELPQMQHVIQPGTPLFLFNVQSSMLMGTFIASAVPERAVVQGAFGGKFNAHVSVALESALVEVKLKMRIASGPKSEAEVEALQAHLQDGKAADSKAQEAWGFVGDVSLESAPAVVAETIEASEDGSVQKVPVLNQGLRALSAEALKDLEADLVKLREESGVSIELLCSLNMPEDSILLKGDPEEVRSIRDWLQSILPFYDVDILEE